MNAVSCSKGVGLELVEFSDAFAFLAATQASLEENETVNNLLLGIANQVKEDPARYPGPPFLAAVLDENQRPILCAVMTPPYPMIISAEGEFGDAINLLQLHLEQNAIRISGVNGREDASDLFAERWGTLTGQKIKLDMSLRAYELRQVIPPRIPEGTFRRASKDDSEAIIKFLTAMHDEVMGESEPKPKITTILKLIDQGKILAWELGGKLVTMAIKGRSTTHGRSVSGVYTPPEERKRGYASACVAMLSQEILDEGCEFVNLFTDLANPTSNAIYQAIGYRPLCDFHRYSFS
jgi:predicted GNAT family acetyltransferase